MHDICAWVGSFAWPAIRDIFPSPDWGRASQGLGGLLAALQGLRDGACWTRGGTEEGLPAGGKDRGRLTGHGMLAVGVH